MDKKQKRELKKIKRLTRQANRMGKGRLPRNVVKGRYLPAIIALVLIFPFIFPPMRFPVSGEISSGFFIRRKPDSINPFAFEFHRGTDYPVPLNTRVRSTASGVVTASGWSDTLGHYVIVKHLLGFSTLYGHLARSGAPEGRLLIRGFTVGDSGSTGRSTGPHLHFEVRFFGNPVPPGAILFFAGTRRSFFELLTG